MLCKGINHSACCWSLGPRHNSGRQRLSATFLWASICHQRVWERAQWNVSDHSEGFWPGWRREWGSTLQPARGPFRFEFTVRIEFGYFPLSFVWLLESPRENLLPHIHAVEFKMHGSHQNMRCLNDGPAHWKGIRRSFGYWSSWAAQLTDLQLLLPIWIYFHPQSD